MMNEGVAEDWYSNFEPLRARKDCAFCGHQAVPARARPDWAFLDGAYCISLRSRPDRAAAAAAEFHRVGLCRRMLFYRPERDHENPARGIWESHRAVARHALARGLRRVLVTEDDVSFSRRISAATVRRVGRALAALPPDWRIFYLGHLPLRAYPVRWNVLRTRSGCAHAYVAHRPLLEWLAATPFAPVPREYGGLVGRGIDAAFAAMPGAYAYFPMLATQAPLASDHMVPGRKPIRKLKHVVTRSHLREILLAGVMRPAEWLALLLAPWWRCVGWPQTGFGHRA